MSTLISSVYGLVQQIDRTSSTSIGYIKDDIEFLKSTCPLIQAVLHDAEEMEIRNKSVKIWLCRLKRFAAEAEDFLEEYEYELCHQKKGFILHRLQKIFLRYLQKDIAQDEERYSVICNSTSFPSLPTSFLKHVSANLQEIRKKFSDIYEQRRALCLENHYGKRRQMTPTKTPSGPLRNEQTIYGREAEKKELKVLLMSSRHGEYSVSVIAISGIGGVGKTTLAQFLYDDEEIRGHFDTVGWVYVSEVFDLLKITKDLLESVTRESCKLTNFSTIQEELFKSLHGKKFLLILDDIWSEEQRQWDGLGFILNMKSSGSKILLTTRTPDAAPNRHSIVYNLKPLSDNGCWELFQRHAFYGLTDPAKEFPFLVKQGRKIVGKCKGLPLMAKVLGDLLRDAKDDEKRWKEILDSDTWQIKDESGKNNVLETLRLSYNQLPMHLKQCFLYCSVYHKNYQFERDELIQLWLAQGLIVGDGSKQIEDVGLEYLDYLLRRSFLQHVGNTQQHSEGKEILLTMHDIMHDLAQYILNEEHSLMSNDMQSCAIQSLLLPNNSPFFRESGRICGTGCHFEPIPGRTYLQSWYPLNETTVDILNVYLKRLRVLILDDNLLASIPDSIGKLKHLRYLCIHSSKVERLPESVCMLHNLQTLRSVYLKMVPEGIRNLKKLRHLLMSDYVHSWPAGIGELTQLQTMNMNVFLVRRQGDYCGLSELKNLSCLKGSLKIACLNNVITSKEARSANLHEKENLKELRLWWDSSVIYEKQKVVLENLKPHINLETLSIYGYGGITFPAWLGDQSFNKLTKLYLSDLPECQALPAVGQLPTLKILHIRNLLNLEQVDLGFYGWHPQDAFPLLEELSFFNMWKWTKWCGLDVCGFPCLSQIEIIDCPFLDFTTEETVPRMFLRLQQFTVSRSPLVQEWCMSHSLPNMCQISYVHIPTNVGSNEMPTRPFELPHAHTRSYWRRNNLYIVIFFVAVLLIFLLFICWVTVRKLDWLKYVVFF